MFNITEILKSIIARSTRNNIEDSQKYIHSEDLFTDSVKNNSYVEFVVTRDADIIITVGDFT